MDWTNPAAILAHLRDRLARFEHEAPNMMQSEHIKERAQHHGHRVWRQIAIPEQAATFDEAVAAHNKTVALVARVRTLRAA